MHALRAALRVFAFFCTRFARRGSAPLPRVRRSYTAVSSEVCGGFAPTPPGLFGGGERFGSRIGLGWCGGAEPLRAKRVHKKAKNLRTLRGSVERTEVGGIGGDRLGLEVLED